MRRRGGSVPAGEHRGAPLIALRPLACVVARRRGRRGGAGGEAALGDGTSRVGGGMVERRGARRTWVQCECAVRPAVMAGAVRALRSRAALAVASGAAVMAAAWSAWACARGAGSRRARGERVRRARLEREQSEAAASRRALACERRGSGGTRARAHARAGRALRRGRRQRRAQRGGASRYSEAARRGAAMDSGAWREELVVMGRRLASGTAQRRPAWSPRRGRGSPAMGGTAAQQAAEACDSS